MKAAVLLSLLREGGWNVGPPPVPPVGETEKTERGEGRGGYLPWENQWAKLGRNGVYLKTLREI